MAFELLRERRGGVLVLTPRGRLDNDNAPEFELAAQEIIGGGERHVIVDLAQLTYTSNAGLRVLGKIGKALRGPSTSLRLCGLTPALRQVFDAAGIASVFDVRVDLDAALSDHPAARGAGEIGQHVARLLGVAPPPAIAPPGDEAARTLATLALDLMAGNATGPRASRPLVDATQLVPRVRPEDIARVRAAESEARRSWWQRLFGRGK